MAAPGGPFRRLLFDPSFWQPRLQRLTEEPRGLVQIPRPDLCRPGIEVVELRMRAHDGASLRALLAHSAYHRRGDEIHVRVCADLETSVLDWRAVETGASDLVFHYPPHRRLEDRVLDVLRVTEAACSIESVPRTHVAYAAGHHRTPDEFLIAAHFRDQGWAATE